MAKILYQNKVALNPLPSISNENKVTDADMNEIKTSVNDLYDYPIDVSTSGITNGTDQCVLFESGGKVEQSILFKFDPATGRFNINNVASPTAQINVKATNDMSGSAWLVLRDSTDTMNRFQFNNDGTAMSRGDSAIFEWYTSANNIAAQIGVSGGRGYAAVPGAFIASNNASNNVASVAVNGNTKAKFYIGAASGNSGLPNEASSNIMFMRTGVNPTLNWALGYQQFSTEDTTDPNPANHFHFPKFRLSNGHEISLKPLDWTGVTTVSDIITKLQSIGL